MRCNMKRVNLYTIQDEIEKVSNIIKAKELSEFRPVDYAEFIRKPLDSFVKVWKYEGVYYSSPKKLYNVLYERGIYTRDSRTFDKLCNDINRQDELWGYKIQVVFMVYLDVINRYITCEGIILTTRNLSIIRNNPYNSYFKMVHDGEPVFFNRAKTVWKYFVNEMEDSEDMYHIDRNFGNCGIDNLFISVPK